MRTIRGSSRAWFNLKLKKKRKRKTKTLLYCYVKRNYKLDKIGFSNYDEYLKSDIWKYIRSRKFSRRKYCVICKSYATQVHHMEYSLPTLLGAKKHQLVVLCPKCYKEIEYSNETKLTLDQANTKLIDLASKTEHGKRWLSNVLIA